MLTTVTINFSSSLIFTFCYRKMFPKNPGYKNIRGFNENGGPLQAFSIYEHVFFVVSLFSILTDFYSLTFADLRQKTKRQYFQILH